MTASTRGGGGRSWRSRRTSRAAPGSHGRSIPRAGSAPPALVVAEIARQDGGAKSYEEPDVVSLAWDETRGVVWAAGRFGLLAFQTRTDPASLSAPPKCGA